MNLMRDNLLHFSQDGTKDSMARATRKPCFFMSLVNY